MSKLSGIFFCNHIVISLAREDYDSYIIAVQLDDISMPERRCRNNLLKYSI